jgi:hypothetical protein
MPDHPTKMTPRGGAHHVFRGPVLSKIATRANALGPGIDVEAAGPGVMFCPPTPGYAWELSPFDVVTPHLPLWLWRLLPKVEARPSRLTRRGGRSWGVTAGQVIEACQRLGRIKNGRGGHLVICPAHADRHNSLSVAEGSDGKALVFCFAGCSYGDIVAGIERLLGIRQGVA